MQAALLLFLRASCATTFATFGAAHARAVAHRWRPVVVSVDADVTLVDPDALRRYTRAMIACNGPKTYAVSAVRGDALTLYVIGLPACTVDAILWSRHTASASARAHDLRALCAWHNATLHTSLAPGRALEVADRRLFDAAPPPPD